jgi:REP element-mobilizing transposase RayT
MREQSTFSCVRRQIRAAQQRYLRIVHFSVQSNHLHLLVEANDSGRLSAGMKGFGVRLARHLNRLLGSSGNVVADRYHARALQTPREVRNALVYVLFNHKKHGRAAGIDRCSSARFFDGWSEPIPKARGEPDDWPLAPAQTWLLKRGWKRLGHLELREGPSHGAARVRIL